MYPYGYNLIIYTILQTDTFAAWLDGLKDGQTRKRLARRLGRAELGNLGDVKAVGDGV